ncbi:MAG: tetratricopeptide repeat protein [Verrucomicrobiae bacterium]|nr:tetratricopeptide repeat protein [Verrucomicrobiae bacterium]
MSRWLSILIRCALAFAMSWWLWRRGDLSNLHQSPLLLVSWVVLIGCVWFVLLGWHTVERFAERFSQLGLPTDDQLEVRPQYSIAEARAAQGRYHDAIAEFRRVIEQHPNEPFPHIRIAELLHDKLQNPDAAIAELQIALQKAQTDDAFAIIANRLADWLLQHRHDIMGAKSVLQAICTRYPSSRHARAARERLARIAAAATDGQQTGD